ncbi:hypothetical protein [Streptomyces sp. NPDC020965]|uniref:hypothetical protein n=1 Tax=Streptomyces sp. NPDC020965 TaxID=3365105 RepID=UPI0037B60EF2
MGDDDNDRSSLTSVLQRALKAYLPAHDDVDSIGTEDLAAQLASRAESHVDL